MRSKHASQCHELSCAALVMAMAAAATATVGGAAAGVRAAAPAHPLAFGVASPARRFASRGGSTVTTSAAKQRVQALSMTLVAAAPARPAARRPTVDNGADSIRRRRRRRPFGESPADDVPATSGSAAVADMGARHDVGRLGVGGVGVGVGVGVGTEDAGSGLARCDSLATAPRSVLMGWHPASEPDDGDTDDTHYDSWRRLRVEELVKDQFLTPGRVNEIMDPNNLQRHKYNTNPDSSFAAVFQLDTLVDIIPELIYPAWLEVARALNQNAPSLITVQRGYGWTPEQMFLREFNWRLSQEDLEGGMEVYDRTILRKALKYQPVETPGSRRWLETLRRIPMPMAVLSRLPASVVESILEKTDLAGYFPHRVTAEDERFDDYRGYMLAAIKVQRSTMKCCAFDCRQEGMIKAHDADLRGVCRVGVMAAWELRLADYSVESFDDMTILDFRQLFADREFEPGGLQLELEPEAAPQRQVAVATKVETETRWADEDEEPETWSDRGGGEGGGGRRGGGAGLRRRY